MGGGIALSYALNRAAPPVDGYVLAAPLLGPDAPTARAAPAPGEAARTAARFMYFRTPRLIGAIMLNLIGVRAANRLPILYLNQAGAPAYGFAALQSMQPNPPEDYCVALRAISVPLLVIAGTRDEAFEAARYPDVVRRCSQGEAVLVDGASHNSVLTDLRTIGALTSWARAAHLVSSSRSGSQRS